MVFDLRISRRVSFFSSLVYILYSLLGTSAGVLYLTKMKWKVKKKISQVLNFCIFNSLRICVFFWKFDLSKSKNTLKIWKAKLNDCVFQLHVFQLKYFMFSLNFTPLKKIYENLVSNYLQLLFTHLFRITKITMQCDPKRDTITNTCIMWDCGTANDESTVIAQIRKKTCLTRQLEISININGRSTCVGWKNCITPSIFFIKCLIDDRFTSKFAQAKYKSFEASWNAWLSVGVMNEEWEVKEGRPRIQAGPVTLAVGDLDYSTIRWASSCVLNSSCFSLSLRPSHWTKVLFPTSYEWTASPQTHNKLDGAQLIPSSCRSLFIKYFIHIT